MTDTPFYGPVPRVSKKGSYEALYVPTLNPHLLMSRVSPKGDGLNLFQCQGCKLVGTLEGLNNTVCTVPAKPCKSCGLTPICSPDCSSVKEAIQKVSN